MVSRQIVIACVAVAIVVPTTITLVLAQGKEDQGQDSQATSQAQGAGQGGRRMAPPHSRPVVERDGKTLLWANGDETGEGDDVEWFDMTDSLIDPRQFQYGIGKDSIPSIDDPVFLPVDHPQLAAAGIRDSTRVMGFEHDGVAKAYPIQILSGHEVVNDEFNGVPFAVCW